VDDKTKNEKILTATGVGSDNTPTGIGSDGTPIGIGSSLRIMAAASAPDNDELSAAAIEPADDGVPSGSDGIPT
jgi:hypothetical protein